MVAVAVTDSVELRLVIALRHFPYLRLQPGAGQSFPCHRYFTQPDLVELILQTLLLMDLLAVVVVGLVETPFKIVRAEMAVVV